MNVEIEVPRAELTVLAIRDERSSSSVPRPMSNFEQLVVCEEQPEEKIHSSWDTPISIFKNVSSTFWTRDIPRRSTLCLTLCPKSQISKANIQTQTRGKNSAGCMVIPTLCDMTNDGLSALMFEKLIEENVDSN